MMAIPRIHDVRPLVHVVVSCKSRKTTAIPRALQMSSVRGRTLDDRVRNWVEKIENSKAGTIPAGLLYAGDHWKVVLRIPEAAPQLQVKLWVASAGYGLVPIDGLMKPYSATFIRPHRESVTPDAVDFSAADWWRSISKWKPHRAMPRSVAALARAVASEEGFLLLALSAPYALALAEDIAAATRVAPNRVALVSVGLASAAAQPHGVGSTVMPVEARLKRLVGGAMQGVNARLAHLIAREHKRWYPSVSRLRTLIEGWVSSSEPLPQFTRDKMEDQQVRSFIAQHADTLVGRSKSTLLRHLRDSGMACEQARFGRLYREVKSERSDLFSSAGEVRA